VKDREAPAAEKAKEVKIEVEESQAVKRSEQ